MLFDMAVKEKPSSFSRQTTWEGIDTASAAFSRGTSLASAWDPLPDRTAGVPPPLPELSDSTEVTQSREVTHREAMVKRSNNCLMFLEGWFRMVHYSVWGGRSNRAFSEM